jgi:hypothetical protein
LLDEISKLEPLKEIPTKDKEKDSEIACATSKQLFKCEEKIEAEPNVTS